MTQGIPSKGQVGPLASPSGVPHTALQSAKVHDAFPPFPQTKKNRIVGKQIGAHEMDIIPVRHSPNGGC